MREARGDQCDHHRQDGSRAFLRRLQGHVTAFAVGARGNQHEGQQAQQHGHQTVHASAPSGAGRLERLEVFVGTQQ